MKYVNVIDAKEQFAELMELLDSYQQDKIVVTKDGKPIMEMVRPENPIAKKRLPGLGKDKFTFDNKLFDDLDSEIAQMFLKEQAQ